MARKHITSRTTVPVTELVAPVLGKPHCVYLLPGEFHVAAIPTQITTILGSCVSICLWDSRSRVGGMNHFLFPEWHDGDGPSTRFGNLAALSLLSSLVDVGCEPRNLKAKLFGGAALFTKADRYAVSLGAKNVEIAERTMARAGVPIIAQDTGGQHGRKVIFDTTDGTAWSRKV